MTFHSDVNEVINQALQVASPESSTAQTGNTGISATASVDVPEVSLESLADFNDEGETGWNAQGRADMAKKMQRIAAGINRYSHDEIKSAVVRAEELAEVGK